MYTGQYFIKILPCDIHDISSLLQGTNLMDMGHYFIEYIALWHTGYTCPWYKRQFEWTQGNISFLNLKIYFALAHMIYRHFVRYESFNGHTAILQSYIQIIFGCGTLDTHAFFTWDCFNEHRAIFHSYIPKYIAMWIIGHTTFL